MPFIISLWFFDIAFISLFCVTDLTFIFLHISNVVSVISPCYPAHHIRHCSASLAFRLPSGCVSLASHPSNFASWASFVLTLLLAQHVRLTLHLRHGYHHLALLSCTSHSFLCSSFLSYQQPSRSLTSQSWNSASLTSVTVSYSHIAFLHMTLITALLFSNISSSVFFFASDSTFIGLCISPIILLITLHFYDCAGPLWYLIYHLVVVFWLHVVSLCFSAVRATCLVCLSCWGVHPQQILVSLRHLIALAISSSAVQT